MKDIFVRRLQRAGYFSFLYRLIPTVTDLIFAMMLSKLVLDAVEGQVKKVIFIGSIIVGFTAVIKSIMIIVQIKSEKYIFNTEHICKMNLYHKLLSNPLSVLYSMQEGNTIEILRDDFNTIISQYISVYPQLGVGVMTVNRIRSIFSVEKSYYSDYIMHYSYFANNSANRSEEIYAG